MKRHGRARGDAAGLVSPLLPLLPLLPPAAAAAAAPPPHSQRETRADARWIVPLSEPAAARSFSRVGGRVVGVGVVCRGGGSR